MTNNLKKRLTLSPSAKKRVIFIKVRRKNIGQKWVIKRESIVSREKRRKRRKKSGQEGKKGSS